jgi:hypothetical protein
MFREKTLKENEMSLILKKDENTGSDFKLLEPGTHCGVCTQIIDFGPQTVTFNDDVKEQNKIRLVFEVPTERIDWVDKEGVEHEGPMTIGKTYTHSMFNLATLRKHLESWRGVSFTPQEEMGFHLKNILGAPCMLSVTHKSYERDGQTKTYANIDGISKLMKGMEAPKPEGDLVLFDFDDHTEAELSNMANWMQEKVNAGKALLQVQKDRTRAYAEKELATMTTSTKSDDLNVGDDDIPF